MKSLNPCIYFAVFYRLLKPQRNARPVLRVPVSLTEYLLRSMISEDHFQSEIRLITVQIIIITNLLHKFSFDIAIKIPRIFISLFINIIWE